MAEQSTQSTSLLAAVTALVALSVLYLVAAGYLGGLWQIAIIFIVLMIFNLYLRQNSLLYVRTQGGPNPLSKNLPDLRSPAEPWGLPFEDLELKTSDGVELHAWFISQPPAKRLSAWTCLYFHGNSSNIGTHLPVYKILHDKFQCNVMAVDYRGYGGSDGQPSEFGLNIDAQTAYQHLIERGDIDHSRIILIGSSLGGAVALSLMHHLLYERPRPTAPQPVVAKSVSSSSVPSADVEDKPVAASASGGGGDDAAPSAAARTLTASPRAAGTARSGIDLALQATGIAGMFIENSFLSVDELVMEKYWKLSAIATAGRQLLGSLLTSHWRSDTIVSKLPGRILFIHGEADGTVPCSHSQRLYQLASRAYWKQLVEVPGVRHGRLPYDAESEWVAAFQRLLDACGGSAQEALA